jgi:hypothetical protein
MGGTIINIKNCFRRLGYYMERIRVSAFEGVDVTQGLIFLDEDTYDIKNITAIDHVIIEPSRTIYRICIFSGISLMVIRGFLNALGISMMLLGIILGATARPKHSVLIKTLPNIERLFISRNFEELEKIGRALRSARYWQNN